jgi:hypothetical protein
VALALYSFHAETRRVPSHNLARLLLVDSWALGLPETRLRIGPRSNLRVSADVTVVALTGNMALELHGKGLRSGDDA